MPQQQGAVGKALPARWYCSLTAAPSLLMKY